jgi:hypothetical protein
MKRSLETKLEIKNKALLRSIKYGHLSSTISLIKSGADCSNPELIVIAAINNKLDILKLLIENNVNMEKITLAMNEAYDRNYKNIVELLIENGADENQLVRKEIINEKPKESSQVEKIFDDQKNILEKAKLKAQNDSEEQYKNFYKDNPEISSVLEKVESSNDILIKKMYFDIHPSFNLIKKIVEENFFDKNDFHAHKAFRYLDPTTLNVYDHLKYFQALLEKYLQMNVETINIIDTFMDNSIKNKLIMSLADKDLWYTIKYLFKLSANPIEDDSAKRNDQPSLILALFTSDSIISRFLKKYRDDDLLIYILDHSKFDFSFHYNKINSNISNYKYREIMPIRHILEHGELPDFLYIKQVKKYLSYTLHKMFLIYLLIPFDYDVENVVYGQVRDVLFYIRMLYLQTYHST